MSYQKSIEGRFSKHENEIADLDFKFLNKKLQSVRKMGLFSICIVVVYYKIDNIMYNK